MARYKRFRDEEGNYLTSIQVGEEYSIAWFIPSTDDYGLFLGEDKDSLETKAAAPYASYAKEYGTLIFSSRSAVMAALRSANQALLSREVIPEWVAKAKAAGWTPPPEVP